MATIEATLPTLTNGQNGHVAEIEAVELNGAQIVCKALEAEGVEIVFGYPGGAVIPLYDALPEAGFHHVLTRFEQWAALAADGYARATGKVGVCIATSGPGATNLVTGLANAQLDSVPMVAITGQVVQPLIGKDAFQECDITGITLAGHQTQLSGDSASRTSRRPSRKRSHLAHSGRPGPVLVDIPKKPLSLRRGLQTGQAQGPSRLSAHHLAEYAAGPAGGRSDQQGEEAADHGRSRHHALRRRGRSSPSSSRRPVSRWRSRCWVRAPIRNRIRWRSA